MVEYSREEKYSRPTDIKGLLHIALQKERASFGFYAEMLKQPFASSLQGLIGELRDAEAAHIKRIELKLAEIEKPF